MAQFANMFEVDLNNRSYPVSLVQTVSEGNVYSNRIGAYVYKDGHPYNLGGACTGLVMRADGTTVPLTGYVEGNAAYVVLDQPSCAIPGPIQVAVNSVVGENITTLLVAYGTVIQTDTRNYVEPGTPIPDITELLAEIDNMREATAEAEAAATKSVRYDTAQSLTGAQKGTARGNIDAAGLAQVVRHDASQNLTETQKATARGNIDAAGLGQVVRHDVSQNLTETQKTTARGNIDAAGLAQVVRYDTTQSLTETQKTTALGNIDAVSTGRIEDIVSSLENRELIMDLLGADATYGYQFLVESTAVNGSFWYVDVSNHIGIYQNNNTRRYMPILLYAGVKYTFINVYGYFTIFTDLDKSSVVGRLTQTESTSVYTAEYTPAADCYAFVTRDYSTANALRQPTMLVLSDIYPSNYVEGVFDCGYTIKAKDCAEFVNSAYQLLNEASAVDNSCWNWSSDNYIGLFSVNGTKRYERVFLKANVLYKFWNAYGYFTLFADYNGHVFDRLSSDPTDQVLTKTYKPSTDCYAYVTYNTTLAGNAKAMLTDSVMQPAYYAEGVYYASFSKNLYVKQDGTGDYTSVVDAVNYANSFPGSEPVNVYIYTGVYDILEELGGQTFIDSLDNWTYELQGLRIQRDNVNLIGIGYPQLVFRMPGTVTRQQSERTSCLNLTHYSTRVENLVLIAKNCRYVIHDEGNGHSIPVHHVLKNLRCIHEGNAAGLWAYPTVLGGGNTGGSTYDLINCQFITDNYMQAMSYHCGSDQFPSKYNIDGCVGIANNSDGISFRFSYLGPSTPPLGNTVVNLKNCSGNARIVVEPERSGNPEGTPNFIELYNNGYNNIE